MAIPILGLVGLAIDYAFWNQANSSMSLAASGAALNAVKITAAATLANDKNAIPEGVTAGKQWFLAQVGTASNAAHLNVAAPTVVMTTGSTTTAQVSYSGTVPSIFGKLFAIGQYPISVEADAQITTSPYLNVEVLLDNSPSMEIGATPGDINAMMYLTPCSVPGAYWSDGKGNGYGNSYSQYVCTYGGNTYDGQNQGEAACPVSTVAGITLKTTPLTPNPSANKGPQTCANLQPEGTFTAYIGSPCAFACHSDTSNAPLSPTTDFYGLARATVGKGYPNCFQAGAPLGACAITLRIDLVKEAVNQVITTMQGDNIGTINNLNVGVFAFDSDVHQIYPEPSGACTAIGGLPNNSLKCQAGNDWATALNDVGLPSPYTDMPDTGKITTYAGPAQALTNMPAVFNNLATEYLTAAGDGSSPTTPLKVLFLVTDGLADYMSGNQQLTGINPALCQTYKNMGYTVYVLYTPYYPLMNNLYLGSLYGPVEGSASTSIVPSMQACATDATNDYILANPTDSNSISAALQVFLKRALTSSARFTY